jgi:hypothetical protein
LFSDPPSPFIWIPPLDPIDIDTFEVIWIAPPASPEYSPPPADPPVSGMSAASPYEAPEA